ncbi:MAG: hypothetical protein NZ744_11300 [Pirellulaceae bacterium]|nr:hypothetical protein [Pirellulaceae bacterium]
MLKRGAGAGAGIGAGARAGTGAGGGAGAGGRVRVCVGGFLEDADFSRLPPEEMRTLHGLPTSTVHEKLIFMNRMPSRVIFNLKYANRIKIMRSASL